MAAELKSLRRPLTEVAGVTSEKLGPRPSASGTAHPALRPTPAETAQSAVQKSGQGKRGS